MVKRNQALVVIFSILTCGIYSYYWTYVMTRDIEEGLVKKDGTCSQPGLAVLYMILTCGIYGYYWWFQQGKRIAQLQRERGMAPADNSLAYLLLSVFGLSIVSVVLLQSDMNRIIDRPKMPPPAEENTVGGNTGNDGFSL